MGGLTYFRFLHTNPVSRDYWGPAAEIGRIAASVARGRGFSSPYWTVTGPTAEQPPLFPYLLAGVFKLFGVFTTASAFVILSIDCLFSALTSVFVFLTAKKVFGATVGVLAGWVWVFWPSAAFTPVTHLWNDSLSALLFSVAFWVTLRLETSEKIGTWVGLGLLWGVAGLTNPALLAPMPFLFAWVCFRRRNQKRPWVSGMMGAALIFALTLLPWFVRNYRTFGGRVFLIDDFGLELHIGNHPGATPTHAGPGLFPTESQAEWREYQRLGETAYMAAKQRQALAYIEGHPVTYARLCLGRFGEFWIWTGKGVLFARILGRFGGNLVYFLLPALGVIGLFVAFREGNSQSLPFLLTLCTFPLVYMATAVDPRFRHPIEPALVILGTYAVTSATRRVRGWRAPIPLVSGSAQR